MNEDQVRNEDQSNDGIVDNSKDVVSHESFKKLLAQRKADQERLKTTQAELETFRLKEAEIANKEAELEEKRLRDEGNWKAIVDSKEHKVKTLEEKNKELLELTKAYEAKFTDSHKINAFHEAIGGKLKKDAFYKHVDTSKIAIDPETGMVDTDSLKNYANEFLTEFKDLVNVKVAKLPGEPAKDFSSNFSLNDIKSKDDIKKALAAVLGKK